MTGEVFALLTHHSFIARSATPVGGPEDRAAFRRGLEQAAVPGDAAFLSVLFSARTGMLAGQLAAPEIRDYVSGLMIGQEFREARTQGWFQIGDRIGIVGNDGLNGRYAEAAEVFGLTVLNGGEDAAVAGALALLGRINAVLSGAAWPEHRPAPAP